VERRLAFPAADKVILFVAGFAQPEHRLGIVAFEVQLLFLVIDSPTLDEILADRLEAVSFLPDNAAHLAAGLRCFLWHLLCSVEWYSTLLKSLK